MTVVTKPVNGSLTGFARRTALLAPMARPKDQLRRGAVLAILASINDAEARPAGHFLGYHSIHSASTATSAPVAPAYCLNPNPNTSARH
jgi:hypothetical protein